MKFIYTIKPPRANFPDTVTPDESEIISEHFNYLKKLTDNKVVFLAGRCIDGTFGICIFNAENADKANEIMNNDPAVLKKVFTAELKEFTIALLRE